MSIWVTGDFHGDPCRLSNKNFPEQKDFNPDEENVIIQLGDFGIIWSNEESKDEKHKLDWLAERNFTLVFVDGNHENFPRIKSFPVKEWNGGLVNEIRPNVLHLQRGEVYTIAGKKFFAFGGAASHDVSDGILDYADEDWREKARALDKQERYCYRVKGLDWWEEELPTEEEMQNGLRNLEKHNWSVDYVITHSPPASVIGLLGSGLYKQDRLTQYLESIRERLDFKKHFMGHLHVNEMLFDKDVILYEQIIRIL